MGLEEIPLRNKTILMEFLDTSSSQIFLSSSAPNYLNHFLDTPHPHKFSLKTLPSNLRAKSSLTEAPEAILNWCGKMLFFPQFLKLKDKVGAN